MVFAVAIAQSTIGNGGDELDIINIQNAADPFDAPVQFGPSRRSDARHRATISAIFKLPLGIPGFTASGGLPLGAAGQHRRRRGPEPRRRQR